MARVLPGGLRAAFFSARRRAALPLLLLGAALAGAGCATQSLQPEAPAGRATVTADPAISAGLPIQLRLRQVDAATIGWRTATVELPAGHHRLLVDCQVAATRSTRRFALEVELEAGAAYRLVARTSARDCDQVELVPR